MLALQSRDKTQGLTYKRIAELTGRHPNTIGKQKKLRDQFHGVIEQLPWTLPPDLPPVLPSSRCMTSHAPAASYTLTPKPCTGISVECAMPHNFAAATVPHSSTAVPGVLRIYDESGTLTHKNKQFRLAVAEHMNEWKVETFGSFCHAIPAAQVEDEKCRYVCQLEDEWLRSGKIMSEYPLDRSELSVSSTNKKTVDRHGAIASATTALRSDALPTLERTKSYHTMMEEVLHNTNKRLNLPCTCSKCKCEYELHMDNPPMRREDTSGDEALARRLQASFD